MLAELIGHWRRLRGLTQEEIADALGHSIRHLSFLETARARPSQATLRNLIGVLGIPKIDGDQLMRLAGFAPDSDTDVGDWGHLNPSIEQFINTVLAGVWPNPANLSDARQRMVRINTLAASYLSRFAHLDDVFDDGYLSWMRLVFHPEGLRTVITDWEPYAAQHIQVVHRDRYRIPEIGERVYQDILKLTDLPISWTKLNDTDVLPGPVELEIKVPLGLARLRNVNVMVTGTPSRYAFDFPDFAMHVQMAADDETHEILTKMHETIDVDAIHPRLLPALVR